MLNLSYWTILSSKMEEQSTRRDSRADIRLALQVAEAGLALDVGVGARRIEGCRRGIAGLARAADLAEEGLEPGRGHGPGHLQVAGAAIDDLVLDPGRGHAGGAGH